MKDKQAETGQRITWRSLTFQLLAIVVFPLIALLLVITFTSTTLHQNAMRELVGERDERAALMASTAIEDQLNRRANEIRGLAAQVSLVPTGQAGDVLQNALYLAEDFDAGLTVLGKDGQAVTFQEGFFVWKGQPELVKEGLRALERDASLPVYISNPAVRPGQQDAVIVVIAPSADRQSFVAGAFYTHPFADQIFANVTSFEGETSIAIVAKNGEVHYRNGAEAANENISQHVGVAEALDGQHGTTYIDAGDSEHVVAFSPVAPLGWALLIEEPWEQVASPMLQTTLMAPLVLVPVLLLALLALFFGIRQIVQPLHLLSTQSSRLGWGDYSAIEKPVGGVSEIRQLQVELIHMAHKLRAAQQSLHSFIGAITIGQEEERRRLARELHDETIQSLISLKQQIQLVEMDHADQPVAAPLVQLEAATEQTIENVRRMVSALRPIYLEDLGLVAALNMLVSETAQKSKTSIVFEKQGKERRLDPAVELALYRIVQEALNNIAHHAGASYASVTLTFQQEAVKIEIADNGKGFRVPNSPAVFATGGHFGLLGMFERAELVGGSLRVQSMPGEGTILTVAVANV